LQRSHDVEFFVPIDIALLQPIDATLEKMKDCINKPKGKSVWDIVDFMKQNC